MTPSLLSNTTSIIWSNHESKRTRVVLWLRRESGHMPRCRSNRNRRKTWTGSMRRLDWSQKERGNSFGTVTPLDACWVNEIVRICAWEPPHFLFDGLSQDIADELAKALRKKISEDD